MKKGGRAKKLVIFPFLRDDVLNKSAFFMDSKIAWKMVV